MYLAYDGDKVGSKLESLLIDNIDAQIEEYAIEVSSALNTLEKALILKGCKILFASGDSLLAKSNTAFDPKNINRKYGQITFSLGVGSTPLNAMLALKKAKASGFGKVFHFELKENTK